MNIIYKTLNFEVFIWKLVYRLKDIYLVRTHSFQKNNISYHTPAYMCVSRGKK